MENRRMIMKRTVALIGAVAAAVLAAACEKLDVVASDSERAFGEMLEKIPGGARNDTSAGVWRLSVDGTARFAWAIQPGAASPLDLLLEFDAAPFIAAGLDTANPPDGFTLEGNTLRTGLTLGVRDDGKGGEPAALASFRRIARARRDILGYHTALGHYGLSLGGGNMFEWAKDLAANDKDVVFVLNPAPFAAAGVDTNRVAGWVLAEVPVDDENGRPTTAMKLLKPFNLQ
jgi:hypothetical protein